MRSSPSTGCVCLSDPLRLTLVSHINMQRCVYNGTLDDPLNKSLLKPQPEVFSLVITEHYAILRQASPRSLFFRLTLRFWASAGAGGRTRAQTAAHCDADDACVSSRVRGGWLPFWTYCAPLDACCGRGTDSSLQRSRLDAWFWAQICPDSESGRQERGGDAAPRPSLLIWTAGITTWTVRSPRRNHRAGVCGTTVRLPACLRQR